jgi:glycosyltransferase involved in cell wall biosynthesis
MEKSLLVGSEAGCLTSPAKKRALRVLFVSTTDQGGGAEISAWNLFKTYRSWGYESWMAVGKKRTDDPYVVAIPNEESRSAWSGFWTHAANRLAAHQMQMRGISRLTSLARWIGDPPRRFAEINGHEDFHYPGSWKLLDLASPTDIIHCYNLHGSYFDLRVLPWLSHKRPLILDLRDAWLLSGHCSHSFECDRWKTGCGQCPDLTTYPSINRDATAYNWRRKKQIFAKSRLYVATPSRWLMQKVEQSMLAAHIIESKIIPTGVDLSIFQPAERPRIRAKLNVPPDAAVLLFAGNGIQQNIFKDYRTIHLALRLLSERLPDRKLLFIALGEDAPAERIGNAELRFVRHVKKPEEVASYYQAADVYVHAAVAETFPRAILEALACGTPVVATGVGGIPEQINSFDAIPSSGRTEATGVVVPPADAHAISAAVEMLLRSESLRCALGANAVTDVRRRFDLTKQASCYLDWYQSLVERPEMQ